MVSDATSGSAASTMTEAVRAVLSEFDHSATHGKLDVQRALGRLTNLEQLWRVSTTTAWSP